MSLKKKKSSSFVSAVKKDIHPEASGLVTCTVVNSSLAFFYAFLSSLVVRHEVHFGSINNATVWSDTDVS